MLVPLELISEAERHLKPHLAPTPAIRSHFYSDYLGAETFFKLEMLQPTHSFKARGAFNAALALSDEARARGLITASGGNHGLALSQRASILNVTATVYLPTTTPTVKIEAIRRLGAEVVLHGVAWDDANNEALRVAAESGCTYVHPFDSEFMMAGAATIVTELLQQIGAIDLLVVSIGGGGLIGGVLSAVQHFSPRTRVVGVETVGADSMYQSVHAGHLVELAHIDSIVESLGARRPGQRPYDIVSQYAEDVVTVSDEEAVAALVQLLGEEKLLVEPAASCCLAALTLGKINVRAGERVAVVLCGANLSLATVRDWLPSALPENA